MTQSERCRNRWSAVEREVLQLSARRGNSQKIIARILRRSHSAVGNQLRRIGIYRAGSL